MIITKETQNESIFSTCQRYPSQRHKTRGLWVAENHGIERKRQGGETTGAIKKEGKSQNYTRSQA